MHKTPRRLLASILPLAFLFEVAPSTAQGDLPWRRSDTTLIQLCFDALDADTAPKWFRGESISRRSILPAEFTLDGRTLTGRPIYQAALHGPSEFRSLVVLLPTTHVKLRIDAPPELAKFIDIWGFLPKGICTVDRDADTKAMDSRPADQLTECPAVGVNASIKIASESEHSLSLLDAKANGPTVFNGLRGCRESAQDPR